MYMADQLQPVRRRVALKLIKSGMDSKQIVARFEAERQALAMMDHQHIAKVPDAGVTDDGTPYFAMELVQGMPITDYCDQERLSIVDRLQLFVQVCRAVQHAHQKGIMHRDLKPSNILVTQHDGEPVAKVIDFGLAKALQSDQRLTDKTLFTEFGRAVGTLEYMSPEQTEMNEQGLDTRTDVYSLGVTLYELLTGSTPVGRDRVRTEAVYRVLELIREEETPRPSRRLCESGEALTGISKARRVEPHRLTGILKGELDWIALKALEKDRERRYDGAGSLADDAQNYLNGDVVTARPPSTGYKLRKAIRKHQAAFISGTLSVLLLMAGLIGTSSMWLRARQQSERADHQRRIAEEERTKVTRQRSGATRQLHVSQMNPAQRAWDDNNAGRARDLLAGQRPEQTGGVDLRGWEWHYLNRLTHSELHVLPVRALSVAFSPDGSLLATGDDAGVLRAWTADGTQDIFTIAAHEGRIRPVAFGRDSSHLVTASRDGTVKYWNIKTGELLHTFPGSTGHSFGCALNPDRTMLAIGTTSIVLWELNTGLQLRTLSEGTQQFDSLAFSPDGRHLVSTTEHGSAASVWDVDTGQEIRRIDGPKSSVTSATFSPDGRLLAIAGFDRHIVLQNLHAGKQIAVLEGHTDFVTSVAFSPDGNYLASASDEKDATVRLWDVVSGREIKRFVGHQGAVLCVVFSVDGRLLITGSKDETLRIWNIETGRTLRLLRGHSGNVESLSVSADGMRLASCSNDVTVRLWDIVTGQEVHTLRPHGKVYSVAFGPDSRRISAGWGYGHLDQSAGVTVWDARTLTTNLRAQMAAMNGIGAE